MMMAQELDTVQLAQAGDAAAFSRLAAQYRAWLLAMAFLRAGDREAAEDLVQEVLVRAWQQLPTLAQPAAFAGWLRAIMVNACRDWHRTQRRAPYPLDEMTPAPTAQTPTEMLLARERQRALRDALFALAPDNRLALLMHVWGDYSYADIARLLDIPVSTVDGRIYRAKQQLRRQLRDIYADLFHEPRPRWREKGTP